MTINRYSATYETSAIIFAVLVWGLLSVVPASAEPVCVVAWDADGPALATGRVLAGGGVHEGRLFVWGGYDTSTSSYLADGWVLDPPTGSWTAVASLPVPTANAGMAIFDDVAYWVAGDANGTTAAVHRYDFAEDQWETLATPYPHAVEGVACTAWETRVLCFGGYSPVAPGTFAAVFDPDDGQWAALASMPGAKRNAAATADGKRVVIAGGWDDVAGADDTVFSFDPVANDYDAIAALVVGRQAPALIGAAGLLWLTGGGRYWDPVTAGDELFDGIAWHVATTTLTVPVVGAVGGYLAGEGVWIAGGQDSAGDAVGLLQRWRTCVPRIDAVEPTVVPGDYPITITGANFEASATAFLIGENDVSIVLSDAAALDGRTIAATVPLGVPNGIYGIGVVGSLGQSARVESMLTVCNGCLIAATCFGDGDANPENHCQRCSQFESLHDWTNLDGVPCADDGLFCTGTETCGDGQCVSQGDPCLPDQQCDEEDDACHSASPDDDSTPADDDDNDDDDVTADDDTVDDDTAVNDDDTTAEAAGSGGDDACGCGN